MENQTFKSVQELEVAINSKIIGQASVVRRLLITLLADGNLLLEGLPGLAKTRAIKSLAQNLSCSLSRIQFTPDLLPSDITGTEVYQPEGKDNSFAFEKGPIFANLVLADEINRAPAKVQAALLEAMEERQVTVAGKTYPMEQLFLVMATQNPVEQEGTYPLPEAQLDRFLMKTVIDYPSLDSEQEVLKLVRGESTVKEEQLKAFVEPQVVFDARLEIDKISVSDSMLKYIVALVDATRNAGKYSNELSSYIEIGASPRGTLALEKCARVVAWFNKREHVQPSDIHEIAHDVLRHRIALSYEANAKRITTDEIIDEIIKLVAVG